jgi:hypothetical protein
LTLAQNIRWVASSQNITPDTGGSLLAVIEALPLARNSDDFVFDSQMLSQPIYARFQMSDISCPAKYFPVASSINFRDSVTYGFGVLRTSISFRLARMGFDRGTIFEGLAGKDHSNH